MEAAMAGRFEILGSDMAGECRWHLQAENGEIVAQSEGYTRTSDAPEGAEAAHGAADGADVVDTTTS
jgi:uncharacterized protein YegP (UPF0339 family)